MTVEREVLERLLVERPGGARSALQAVKEGYTEISLMRELGVTWAEIADLLGRNGAVGRGGKLFTATTVRAAFFLIGAEIRQGRQIEAGGQSGSTELPGTLEAPSAESPSSEDSPSEDRGVGAAFEVTGTMGAEDIVVADPSEALAAPQAETTELQLAIASAEGNPTDAAPDADAVPDSGVAMPSGGTRRILSALQSREDDMLLMTPARSPSVAWDEVDPIAREPVVEPDRPVGGATPAVMETIGPLGAISDSQPTSGRFTADGALTWDWTQRVDRSARPGTDGGRSGVGGDDENL